MDIISTTDKLYRSLQLATTEPPTTKFWPIPLVMASIEAKDPIYRDCALRKLADNQNAGDIYAMSVELVRKVHQIENGGGLRANLEQLMQTMAEGFVL